jgi:transcriptional regulator with XRE-family HTH domain
MSELGERLRAAREEKELAIEQVAEETRIPLNYLEAMESEAFDVFTSDLHTRGFLRNYASFLGLDPAEIVALYDQAHGNPRGKRGATVAPRPVTEQGHRSMLGVDALLGLVVVALLAIAGLSVYQRQNQPVVTPTAGPPPTPTVTPMPVYEGTAYTMDVYLNYAEHKLEVQERIDYTNVTSETLLNLILNVYPNCSKGTFKLGEVRVDMGNGELVQPEVFPLDVPLRVQLPRDLLPNKHMTLFLDFSLSLPKINPDAEFSKAGLGYSKRSVSLGNWYPVLAPYRQDKGWYQLTCFEIGDPYVTEVADYHVSITTTQGVVVAGTGQETRQGNHWQYEAQQARSFAFAASDVYQVATAQAGTVNVLSYYFPNSQDAGEAALQTAVQSMELFSELYGPYPYTDYRVAETEFAGGMEFSGLTFLGGVFYDQYDGTSRAALIPLAAHEAAHQWFYGLVGNDQVTEPWLDEAIAEYSAFLYYERYLPDDTDWWWNYAVDQWAPTGKIDSYVFEFRNNRDYVDAVYRRGAEFIRDLRQTMGDPAFLAFLQEYQRRYKYQLAKSRDFFGLVREFTTADLIPLQEEYFRQRILP